MPFVTVVSMGASAASDFITNAISSRQESKKDLHDTSVLTRIRPMGENELFAEDCVFGNSSNVTKPSCVKVSEVIPNGSVRRKSVSFIDLSNVGLRLSLAPTVSESGYSSNSSTSSGSSTGSEVLSPSAWLDHGNHTNGYGSIQGKTTIWKSWIKNKLHLSKNGKYSLAGSLSSLGHFGIKVVNKLFKCFTPSA